MLHMYALAANSSDMASMFLDMYFHAENCKNRYHYDKSGYITVTISDYFGVKVNTNVFIDAIFTVLPVVITISVLAMVVEKIFKKIKV